MSESSISPVVQSGAAQAVLSAPVETQPSTLILATVHEWDSAVFRVICHSGKSRAQVGEMFRARDAVWFAGAYYPASLLNNGCEPYDQPSPAAYLPFSYSDFDVITLPNGGALLLQRECSRDGFRGRIVHDARQRIALVLSPSDLSALDVAFGNLLGAVGLNGLDLDACVRAVRQRYSETSLAALSISSRAASIS